MNDQHQLLFAVNAGSDDVSVFQVQHAELRLLERVPSGGNFPVGLATYGDWLYVLNAGGDGTIMGYRIESNARLVPMPNSKRTLRYGGKTPPYVFEAPGQIDFSPDGTKLIVIEKGIDAQNHSTHKIHVYRVDRDGIPSDSATVSISYGYFPFASVFTLKGQLLVVEAFGKGPVLKNTGAVTSYQIDHDDCLKVVSGSVDTLHNEACWIAQAGPFAYVTNFASGVITGYRIQVDGSLTRLNADGKTMNTGEASYPTDIAATPDGRFLYALLPGYKQIAIYEVANDGRLTALGVSQGDWPVHIQGIVVR